MIEYGKEYTILLTSDVKFYGILKSGNDEYYEVLTTDTNAELCNGGSNYVQVPAVYYVPKRNIALLKERYSKEEVAEYWTPDDTDYNFETTASKILLTKEQAEKFKGKIFNSEQECKDFIKEGNNG